MKMILRHQLFYALVALVLTAFQQQETCAELTASDNAINNLYENLLQREYAGPVIFPNHQVERKAQRSPSLRLRFGRRSDPDLLPSAEKRWFGDVNQKPIRSPSLRLRFGRRSDPTMPLRSRFDALMNGLALPVNDEGVTGVSSLDYNDNSPVGAYDDEVYERVERKPQRLRWGRSAPYNKDNEKQQQTLNTVENERDQLQSQMRFDDFFNSLLSSEKVRNMLLGLHQYDAGNMASNEDDLDEFQREVRKPAPLRLRWGRSTGGASAATVKDTETQQKKTNLKKSQESTQIQQNVQDKE